MPAMYAVVLVVCVGQMWQKNTWRSLTPPLSEDVTSSQFHAHAIKMILITTHDTHDLGRPGVALMYSCRVPLGGRAGGGGGSAGHIRNSTSISLSKLLGLDGFASPNFLKLILSCLLGYDHLCCKPPPPAPPPQEACKRRDKLDVNHS